MDTYKALVVWQTEPRK